MGQSTAARAGGGAPTMTLEEWADLPEDEAGELVDGHVVEDEEVGSPHDVVGSWLVWALRAWLRNKGGVVGLSDTRFGVTRRRGRKPDVYVYFAGRRPPARGLVTQPPDIMVEVVSPRPSDARRDRVEKMDEYAEFGVRHYWIVDPALRSFEVFELGADGRYVRALGAVGGVVDQVPGCVGLTLDLGELWAEVDRLEDG